MPDNEMPEKEWTLMFYFASDNALTPGVVSQLKAIKQAAPHKEVNVIAHFDPQGKDTPNHVFDVNLMNKLNPKRESGFAGNDPYVRTLMEDKLWRDQRNRDGSDTIKNLLRLSLQSEGITYNPPTPPPDRVVNGTEAPGAAENKDSDRAAGLRRKEAKPTEPGPRESLSNFLEFCSEEYTARHYMLFILGHGMVVGNDIFLFDEHVASDEHSLSLVGLGEVLNVFGQNVRNQGAEFELVSFHSCSVSSLEVAHELQFDQRGKFKGIANYMLASQGPAFVGSWCYREIVTRVINDADSLKGLDKKTQAIKVKEMVVKIFKYILHNSSDFLLAGYSFQVTLCDLNKVTTVTAPLKELSDELVKGLDDSIVRNLILLAHLRAISYWQQNYTDLYDFCLCLINLCNEYQTSSGAKREPVDLILAACRKLIDQLVTGKTGDEDRLIVRADFAGPTYQYSHGLSVFFPWAKPLGDFMDTYKQYRFTATSWYEFLDKYFEKTKRDTRKEEDDDFRQALQLESVIETPAEKLKEDIASICFNNEGPLNTSSTLDDAQPPGKVDVRDPMGDQCTCGSIKNYPRDTRLRRQRAQKAAEPTLPLGPRAFNIF